MGKQPSIPADVAFHPLVEHGVPIPKRNGAPSTCDLYMNLGDSFLIRGASGTADNQVTAWRVRLGRKNYGTATRKVDGGVRIWRIS